MKRCITFMLALLTASFAAAQEIGPMTLEGLIAGDHLTMEMRFDVKDLKAGEPLTVLDGSVALLDYTLPDGVTVEPDGTKHQLLFKGGFWKKQTSGDVVLKFALLQRTEGDKQSVSFAVPVTATRRITVLSDRAGLDVELPSARDVIRDQSADGSDRISGHLGFSQEVALSWKTAVRKLESELIATCDSLTSVTVVPGTVHMRTLLTYNVAQGELNNMMIDVPGVNIIQVSGSDLRKWHVDKSVAALPQLNVMLGRPQKATYLLTVEYERPIAAFPCEIQLDSLVPQGVIRTAGRFLVGTDSAVRLQVTSLSGLTQTDPGAFPKAAFSALPTRSVYAYQYAAVPYALALKADNIVTAITADTSVLCQLADGLLTVEANVQLDVRDAPAREVRLVTDADSSWTVSAVGGENVAENDVDIRPVEGGREMMVPFRKPVEGSVVITLRLEKNFAAGNDSFAVPSFTVADARAQRGYVVAAASQGIRLSAKTATDLTEVHTASTPLRTEGAQLAYRFRESGWKLLLAIERARASVHAELFHLTSLGEGVVYVSTAVTCHISGAPVQSLAFRIPAHITTFDITGANIDTWSRDQDICTVKLMSRVIGDYTVLITYDRPLNYHGGELGIGEVEMIDTESEMGFMAIATAATLKLEEGGAMPPTLIRIGRDEIPAGYAATVTAPIIGAYKYVRRPHAASLKVTPYATEGLIEQVADYLTLSTKIARDCESVTKAVYSVKNATRQYLTLKLPESSVLWSVRQLSDDNSAGRDLAAQQSGGVLLVPVERPRDPNQAVTIEVQYAQSGAKGLRRTTLGAPVLTDAPVTFASWEVVAGDKVSLRSVEGNMTSELLPARKRFPVYQGSSARSRRFYRTANLAGEAPLQLHVELVPAWMGGGSLRVLGGSLALGVLSLIAGALSRRRFFFAVALTAVIVACAQIRYGLPVAGGALLLLPPLLLLAGLVRVIRTASGKRRSESERRDDSYTPPPLVRDDPAAAAGDRRSAVAAPAPAEKESAAKGDAGFARFGVLVTALLTAAAALTLPLLAGGKAPAPANRMEVPMLSVETNVTEQLTGFRISSETTRVDVAARTDSGEYVASVKRSLVFSVERAGLYRLLRADEPSQPALVAFADHPDALISADLKGIVLRVRRPGDYELSFETRETARENESAPTVLTFVSYGGLQSRVEVTLPSAELDVSGTAIAQFVSAAAAEKTTVTGVLTTGTKKFAVSFRPRVRDARREAVVVYCDISTLVYARSGVVDISAWAVYTVAQGEVREVGMRIPKGMGVISVTAPDLATWSMEPTTGLLTALFEKPRTGSFTLQVGMQSACGGVPYSVTLGAPAAESVQRQRGYFALAASESILLKMESDVGVTVINAADFRLPEPHAVIKEEPIRRAYRYDEAAKVSLAFRAEAVQPEIRVVEASAFSIGDERSVLSGRWDITISKAGLFSIELDPPEGYEIETLTGSGVSHWDDARKTGGKVEVFFTSRLLGSSAINLVLAHQQRGIQSSVAVPRVAVSGALRHTGRITVSAERGVRLTLDAQQGVSIVRDEKLRANAGAMIFDILRPAWQVELKTQVLQPVLKPELLHRVDLTEGMLQHRVFVRCKIENAGVKFFRVKVPVKDATLTVSGRGIARVQPEGEAAADGSRVWVVELHGKVEDAYAFTALYQEPYDPAAGGVSIRPFGTPGTARQSAWLAVTGGGRVQVEPRGEVIGLRAEDARALPDHFGAGDLSGAILCYRILQSEYTLDLSVIRHEAARVLLAGVDNARFTTVLSASGKMLTQAVIQLRTGRLRFLKVALPDSSQLWAAQVNGTEVAVARDSEGNLTVPLELLTSEQTTSISLVYADTLSGELSGIIEIPALRFPELPLQDIQWNLYVPPGARYRLANKDFDDRDTFGTHPDGTEFIKTFGRDDYLNINRQQGSWSLNEAKRNLGNISQLLDKGDRIMAQKALQQAVNLSQAEQTLNEDARVQFRNVVQEQVKIGLVNRREALRMDNNIFDESAPQTQSGYNDGNFSREFATQVEEQLTAQDRASLDRVALKIVEQQAAAAGQGSAINIAMPEQGRLLRFSRALQNELGAKMTLAIRVTPNDVAARLFLWWPVLPLCLGLWLLLRIAFGPRRRKAELGASHFR